VLAQLAPAELVQLAREVVFQLAQVAVCRQGLGAGGRQAQAAGYLRAPAVDYRLGQVVVFRPVRVAGYLLDLAVASLRDRVAVCPPDQAVGARQVPVGILIHGTVQILDVNRVEF